jgi:hypothetical protein
MSMNEPVDIRRQEMIRQSRELVLQSAEWLRFADIVMLLGQCHDHSDATPHSWTANKQIFTLNLDGVDHFPSYGLQVVTHGTVRTCEPKPIMAALMAVLGGDDSGWRLAGWFASANGYLHGARPIDLLDAEPSRVLDAAKFAANGIQHG